MPCITILHLRNLLENRLLESFLSANPHSPTLANKGTHQYHVSIFLWRFHFNDSVVNTFVFRNYSYQIWKKHCVSVTVLERWNAHNVFKYATSINLLPHFVDKPIYKKWALSVIKSQFYNFTLFVASSL